MTDGILLAEIQHDPLLLRYDTLVIDEAHERSLNIDFLLGYLHRLLPRRPDLRLIITSATIDVERFSEHFGDAPVIEVSGRSHPVELRYQPLETLSEEGDFGEACRLVMEQIIQEDGGRGGDVLVFLPGEREIRDVARSLRRAQWAGVEVLPLYARLSLAEQNRVFDVGRRRGRRIVLATNVAETSLTVPGIHYVIDVGLARVSRYSVRSRLQRLPVEPISQASADQRAGRCGRIAPGICYRLYSEEDYDSRPEFTDPEIRRTNLAAVILQMLSLGLGDIEAFPFMEPPDPRQISDGFRLLEELGAVDERRQLTDQGRILGRLPVDPRIGRMLVEARSRGALREVLIIASALSCQDPREWPADQRQAAAEQHRRFLHPESDFLAWTALWEHVEEQRQQLTAAPFRRLCQREFLSWLRLREWREVHRQLRLLCRDLDREERGGRWQENSEPADYESIHRSLLSGLLSQIAHRHEGREYQATRNRRVRLFPGSALHAKPPQWLMAAEVVETRQVYARTCARIEPEWVLGINDALLRRSWGEPYWQRRSGRVMARETVMLDGLVLSDGKPVHYGPIDPAGSREVFIQQALVEDQLSGEAEFQRRNRALVAELEELEDKGRRRDILADQQVLYSFFDERIPADIQCPAVSPVAPPGREGTAAAAGGAPLQVDAPRGQRVQRGSVSRSLAVARPLSAAGVSLRARPRGRWGHPGGAHCPAQSHSRPPAGLSGAGTVAGQVHRSGKNPAQGAAAPAGTGSGCRGCRAGIPAGVEPAPDRGPVPGAVPGPGRGASPGCLAPRGAGTLLSHASAGAGRSGPGRRPGTGSRHADRKAAAGHAAGPAAPGPPR